MSFLSSLIASCKTSFLLLFLLLLFYSFLIYFYNVHSMFFFLIYYLSHYFVVWFFFSFLQFFSFYHSRVLIILFSFVSFLLHNTTTQPSLLPSFFPSFPPSKYHLSNQLTLILQYFQRLVFSYRLAPLLLGRFTALSGTQCCASLRILYTLFPVFLSIIYISSLLRAQCSGYVNGSSAG